ncbi:MAG: hypothetical protein AAGK09_03500 [Planctomycetota bacterium]
MEYEGAGVLLLKGVEGERSLRGRLVWNTRRNGRLGRFKHGKLKTGAASGTIEFARVFVKANRRGATKLGLRARGTTGQGDGLTVSMIGRLRERPHRW